MPLMITLQHLAVGFDVLIKMIFQLMYFLPLMPLDLRLLMAADFLLSRRYAATLRLSMASIISALRRDFLEAKHFFIDEPFLICFLSFDDGH